MRVRFGTKAETLERLEPVLRHGRVLPQVRFTVAAWRRDPDAVVADLAARSWLDRPLIVRSSGRREDARGSSLAGRYRSVPNVRGAAAVRAAVTAVARSFDGGRGRDQIFVQPMVQDVRLSGVAFTRDPSNRGHYYVVNYTRRPGDTAAVTSGRGSDLTTYYCDKLAPATREPGLAPLLALLAELEALFATDALDVEFAVTGDATLHLLQVRPLASSAEPGLGCEEHREVLASIRRKVRGLSAPHPYLYGSRAVFGVMPDWNPAEIVGVRPRPLALSLYKELVTDHIWAYQRDNYGYRNLRSFPLVTTFAGQPYVDVRVSFNSFVPRDVAPALAERLVDHYIDRLCATPSHHDKVEFEIIHSCYTIDLWDRLAALRADGFTASECHDLAESLRTLTNDIVHRDTGLWRRDIDKIAELDRRRRRVLASDLAPLAKVYWLLEDCKRYGTLPFAGLARAAFIAAQSLKSLLAVGILGPADHEAFSSSLVTVSSQMAADLAAFTRSAFLEKYGHLRPGTYDVLSPRYDEDPDRYFSWSELSAFRAADRPPPFALRADQARRLDGLLHEHRLAHDAPSLFHFLKSAIEGREYAKFVFTRSLSDAMALLVGLARDLGISRDDLSYADIAAVYRLHGSTDDPAAVLRESIDRGRRGHRLTRGITLPPLITTEEDVGAFTLPVDEPSFITLRSFAGDVVSEDVGRRGLRGRVLMIASADPGYDWIFTHGVGSFITKFGGANSHMAVRAGELGIPAVIGAGEVLYRRWQDAKALEVDCANRHVRVLR